MKFFITDSRLSLLRLLSSVLLVHYLGSIFMVNDAWSYESKVLDGFKPLNNASEFFDILRGRNRDPKLTPMEKTKFVFLYSIGVLRDTDSPTGRIFNTAAFKKEVQVEIPLILFKDKCHNGVCSYRTDLEWEGRDKYCGKILEYSLYEGGILVYRDPCGEALHMYIDPYEASRSIKYEASPLQPNPTTAPSAPSNPPPTQLEVSPLDPDRID